MSRLGSFPKHTLAFLEAVVDPFGSDAPARVPDLERTNSICFRDALEIATPTNVFDGSTEIHGVVVAMTIGRSQLLTDYAISNKNLQAYGVILIGFDENGFPVLTSTSVLQSVTPLNYTTIMGTGVQMESLI
jgi:hypothetical protein